MAVLPIFMNFAFKKHLKDQPETYKSVKELMKQLTPSMTNDDATFTDDIKEALINIMTDPVVVRDVEGGHLAMMR